MTRILRFSIYATDKLVFVAIKK